MRINRTKMPQICEKTANLSHLWLKLAYFQINLLMCGRKIHLLEVKNIINFVKIHLLEVKIFKNNHPPTAIGGIFFTHARPFGPKSAENIPVGGIFFVRTEGRRPCACIVRRAMRVRCVKNRRFSPTHGCWYVSSSKSCGF